MSNLVGQNYQKATPIFTAKGGDKMATPEVSKAEILGDGNTGPVELPFLLIHFSGVDDDGNEIPPANVTIEVGKWLIHRKPGGWVGIGERYTDIFPDDAPPCSTTEWNSEALQGTRRSWCFAPDGIGILRLLS